MMFSDEEKLAECERALGELDFMWLNVWNILMDETYDLDAQRQACDLLLQICERRAIYTQLRKKWQQ